MAASSAARRPGVDSRLVAFLLALWSPAAAGALEPRFDHRDQQGVVAAVETWRDSVAVSGRPTLEATSPRLRLAWSRDVTGEGGELVLGAVTRLDGWRDPERQRFLAGLDARYRGYFGSEELKTFFEAGAWVELKSRVAAGPQVGLGLAYDPSRSWGAFLSVGLATAFGNARIASFGGSAGVQLRFQ
jgi:hypothetical protein